MSTDGARSNDGFFHSRQDIINLFRFIDWLMRLPEKEDRLFWEELAALEEEKKMPYVTRVERIGYTLRIQPSTGGALASTVRLLVRRKRATSERFASV